MQEREYLPNSPDDVDDVVDLSKSLVKWARGQMKNHSYFLISEVLILTGAESLFRNLDTNDAKEIIERFVHLAYQFSLEERI